ncbi:hypothetical protein ABN789_004827 [Salmonella enterica]
MNSRLSLLILCIALLPGLPAYAAFTSVGSATLSLKTRIVRPTCNLTYGGAPLNGQMVTLPATVPQGTHAAYDGPPVPLNIIVACATVDTGQDVLVTFRDAMPGNHPSSSLLATQHADGTMGPPVALIRTDNGQSLAVGAGTTWTLLRRGQACAEASCLPVTTTVQEGLAHFTLPLRAQVLFRYNYGDFHATDADYRVMFTAGPFSGYLTVALSYQ